MDLQKLYIKESKEKDLKDVLFVEQQAFGNEKEAELVYDLLHDDSAKPTVSLLAYNGDEAVGHILFTRARLNGSESPLIYILAPLAVKPEFQRMGIGGILIQHGLQKLKAMQVEIVFVLGHINYYPKHGFINDAERLGFQAPYPIPTEVADAWMAQSLAENALDKYSGKIICAKEMDKPEYWRE